jgi:hypothetical protein
MPKIKSATHHRSGAIRFLARAAASLKAVSYRSTISGVSPLTSAHCLRKFRESWRDRVVSSAELGNHSVDGLDANGYTAVLESGDEHGTKELLSTLEE